ncbi:PAS domain S-box protein [Microcoleus sp. F10-B2]
MYDVSIERLGRIVEESASEIYLFTRQDCRFVLVNKGARDNLGYTFDELRKLTPWDIKPEISQEAFEAMVAPLQRGELPQLDFETVHQRKDGTLYNVTVRLQLIDIGGDPLFFAAILDITDRKNMESALHEASTRLNAILDNTRMAVFMMNDKQHCVFMNSAAERLTGYTMAETLGRPLHDVIHHTHPDGRPFPIEECPIDRAFPENNQTDGEEVFVHKDGSFYPVGFTASPIKDASGITVGTIIEARNIAEDLVAREAMEAFKKTLKSRVDDAVSERRKLETQLIQAQKMEAVGQLTGGIAHDFNNLLQVVGGNLQLLQGELSTVDPRQKRVSTALHAVNRGAELARQLLAFGRQQVLDPKPLNIGRLVRSMDEMLRRTLGDAIEIETVISGGLWNCLADPTQIENVLLNLALNARDAMSGNGKLTIEAGNSVLDDAYVAGHEDLRPGQYVMLAVTDNGSGIPADIRDKVFEPFFTTKGVSAGSGLGLSMVYGFVKQSGGHIAVYSEENEGTTFRIYLPRTVKAELTSVPTGAILSRPGGTETILVVEDDDDVRATSAELLRELGYTVLEANNADNAIAIVNSGIRLDMLFTDVVMPGNLRSPELARLAKVRLPELKVLFTSGYTRNAIVHEGRLDEGVELIAKPFTREALAAKIRSVLDEQTDEPVLTDPTTEVPTTPHSANTEAIVNVDAIREKTIDSRILLVEDEILIACMTEETLTGFGYHVDTVSTVADALRSIENIRYDIVIADLGLPDGSGEAVVKAALQHSGGAGVIIASGGGTDLGHHSGNPRIKILHKPYTEQSIKAAIEELE